jgi:predicted nucleic acid-binding protein
VLSALGRLARAGRLDAVVAAERARTLRHELRLVDGLFVELARQVGLRLITADQRLARATPIADAIS